MPLVSATQLTALRAVGNQGLDSSAVIMRQTQVETAFGSEASWVVVTSDVPCWVRAMGLAASIIDIAMREAIIGSFRIHFEVGTDIAKGDRVVVDGSTFDIIDLNHENTLQIFTTAVGKKVE